MTRFLALVWDDRDLESSEGASRMRRQVMNGSDWLVATDHAGLAVYIHQKSASSRRPISLQQDTGVILGTLFRRSTSAMEPAERRLTIDERQSADIRRTHGRSLVDSDWGSYILFLRRSQEHAISVFRGPAGALSCYYLTRDRCTLFFSHAADLLGLGSSLSINWDSIRAQAAAGDYLTRETGLSEVTAILSGECLDICDGQITSRSYWNPSRFCSDPVRCLADAATLLHLETHRCISAWASLHETLLLLLSGGLDSSIVLSCLRSKSHRTRVIAVNFYSQGAGDERRFARSMTERTNTPLEEIPSNIDIDLRAFADCALTPNPVLNFTGFDVEPVMQRLARTYNATAVFTGETGDDVFGHAPTPDALAEILQSPENIHRFFTAAMDYAELARISVWRAMRMAYVHLKWLRRIRTWSLYRHRLLAGRSNDSYLVSRSAVTVYESMLGRFTHPWFQDADNTPLGKATLIYSLIKATSSIAHSPFSAAEEPTRMSPLVSQPLLEATLRIPSHMHFSGAENGAVVRAAFRSALSPLVLDRGIGKGTPAAWARSLLDRNAAFLSELLLGGWLVQKGILDPQKIQELLSSQISRTRLGTADLVRQVYIETWLRRWIREGARP
ncbi:asparagine synthase-related protein [Steroidobacter flavus]|uniref:asparagine synthase (glutamine-hydrolyzing) n=1 Tax=Steroidobacter flavus TaxID=1842136 RepID=A0ABV8SM05_9GAMM